MKQSYEMLVIGAGIYGITTALELHRRGYDVGVIDPGPLPHPLAASTDVSKVIRMEYGTDDDYMALADEAITGWHGWNDLFADTLYHETGVMMVTRQPMKPGGFVYESYQRLLKSGHSPERLDAGEIARRFPAWKLGVYVDGHFNPRAGFAESGRVVETLIKHARSLGVEVHSGQTAAQLVKNEARVTGVKTRESETFAADHVVVCAGSWTHTLVPELEAVMKATGHPVFHLKPPNPELFTPPNFVVFTADIAATGWYGFPLHPREGIVKIANHGVGLELHPEKDERVVTKEDEANLRRFLEGTFPALVDAPIVYTRRCLYHDTLDEHFWIDTHPEIENLTIGAGGSGHGFKFGPVLGSLIADAVEQRPNNLLPKFRWRELSAKTAGQEQARYHG